MECLKVCNDVLEEMVWYCLNRINSNHVNIPKILKFIFSLDRKYFKVNFNSSVLLCPVLL